MYVVRMDRLFLRRKQIGKFGGNGNTGNTHLENDDKDKLPHSFGYQLSIELGLAVNKEMAILTQSGV